MVPATGGNGMFLALFSRPQNTDTGIRPGRTRCGRGGKYLMAAILLAEADTSMRLFLKKNLERAGHTVIDTRRGDEALTELRLRVFDLLLADVVMPVMDGIELARQAEAIDPEMKIFFITGFAAVTLEPDGAAPDRTKKLSRPFHLRNLVREVDHLTA